jgi:hypothetical protein
VHARPRPRPWIAPRTAAPVLLAALAACSGHHDRAPGAGAGFELLRVEYGQLVDVYGLRRSPAGTVIERYRRDVVIGLDVADERSGDASVEPGVTYDFFGSDPHDLQPRLLIVRELGTPAFDEAFAALDDRLRLLTPGRHGQDVAQQPFSVVPRNAALRLTFSQPLPVGDEFFVARDASGRVHAFRNEAAVQLLRILREPDDGDAGGEPDGGFAAVPARVTVHGAHLVLDPVFAAAEGAQYGVANDAFGLPQAPDRTGANVRLALATEGPHVLPGLRVDADPRLRGTGGGGRAAVIRDFRSGHRLDESLDFARGLLRDGRPPRVVGAIRTYLERVADVDAGTQLLTLWKDGIEHELDLGDALRIVVGGSETVARTVVVAEPQDDRGRPAVARVRVRVQRVPGLEGFDPSTRPDLPVEGPERDAWLVRHAPWAVVACEFTARRPNPVTGGTYGDDPRLFVAFAPAPGAHAAGRPARPWEHVSPHAGVLVRFSEPLDLATVQPHDTLFLATRDLFAPDLRERLANELGVGVDPAWFRAGKFATPHLVHARVHDDDGSHSTLRLQPALGLYLDERMRAAPAGRWPYVLHVLAGAHGVRDLAGLPLDLQAAGPQPAGLAAGFTLDVRKDDDGRPLHDDNLVASVVRRYADLDEDEQPSCYLPDEVQRAGAPVNALAWPLPDVFGSATVADGALLGRPPARVRAFADDQNQLAPPPQGTAAAKNPARWCPFLLGEEQLASPTASRHSRFPQPYPLSPFGSRHQMLWRELDLNLSRTDPHDLDLDVEQMYWAPLVAAPIAYDVFDRASLFLGHAEHRPEPCVQAFGALPSMPNSGLQPVFADNYAHDRTFAGQREPGAPAGHVAFAGAEWVIDATRAFTEPHGVRRYLPLPAFQKPYFVWRDERAVEQGGNAKVGSDVALGGSGFDEPYLLSPFLNGGGRYVTLDQGRLKFNPGRWNNSENYFITQTSRADVVTGGLVGAIAQPLLADFWLLPDSELLPPDDPFRAYGTNLWQTASAVISAPQPNFRSHSGGGLVQGQPRYVRPGMAEWLAASGGYTPQGARTISGDNTFFWVALDLRKRVTVATAGFVELDDPHRMTGSPVQDPRLGPYFPRDAASNRSLRPAALVPRFVHALDAVAGGGSARVEFRAAGPVDRGPAQEGPWYWARVLRHVTPPTGPLEGPTPVNFALDPLKAGDAHVRKYDDRNFGNGPRNAWTGFYNRSVTSWLAEPGALFDAAFLRRFAAGNETFGPGDVSYVNWRVVLENVDGPEPSSPAVATFALSWRFETR